VKLYICVLTEVPDYITPTLVAHATLGAHLAFKNLPNYQKWLQNSFKKCVCRVNRKEFEQLKKLPNAYLAHENKTLGGEKSCAVIPPQENKNLPNVLKFAKLWKPSPTPEVTP
jgi:hypothetical protein